MNREGQGNGSSEIPPCVHCGKPGLWVNQANYNLCIDCNYKCVMAAAERDRMLGQQLNYLTGQMEAAVGTPGLFPRYEVPQPVVHHGPMNLQHITVKDSVVGSVNTGTIEQLDVAINNARAGGADKELLDHLTEVSQAVVNAELTSDKKEELLDALELLVKEAHREKKGTAKPLVTTALKVVGEGIKLFAAGAELWTKYGPGIVAAFGGVPVPR